MLQCCQKYEIKEVIKLFKQRETYFVLNFRNRKTSKILKRIVVWLKVSSNNVNVNMSRVNQTLDRVQSDSLTFM